MNKIINIGSSPIGQVRAEIFCKIKIEAGKLSISGVHGPLKSGNARGSCGQIDSTIRDAWNDKEIKFAPGWDDAILDEFLDTWDKWHLNDMRAGDEHQRSAGWHIQAREKIKITEWHLMGAWSSKKKEIEENAVRALAAQGAHEIGYDDKEVLGLEYSLTTYGDEEPPFNLRMYYMRYKTEEKTRGWISHEDNEIGILSKPCEVCGYKYGSAWKFEELPQRVIEFLESLPESKKIPAWV